MKRETDLIDVWFDSGAMPYAQWHYPFENKEKSTKIKHSQQILLQKVWDQTRGWFYTLTCHWCTLVFDKISIKRSFKRFWF